MTPQAFVALLDRWASSGGPFPRTEPHDLTTAREAQALCRAIASPHVHVPNEFGTTALFDLMGFFQASETQEATYDLRDHGLPLLRRIMNAAFDGHDDAREDASETRKTLLFVVKVLAAYQQRGDAALIVRAARDPRLAEGYLWPVIFGMIAERHPEAVEICERLSDPLPIGSVATPYLDFANGLARERRILRHPFDTGAGIERLCALLADEDADSDGSAISAAASIPFLDADARERLIIAASAHPDPLVRLEIAWAMASLGSLAGHQRLVELCRDPRFSTRASIYLEELGMAKRIPAEAQQPGFRAMAQMCDWLAHPMEYGRPPDEIAQCDTRELNWPPTGTRERFWLFKYGYQPAGAEEGNAGIGLVGSITFALSDTTPDLSPEDVYGLHCCWELRQHGDSRAPKEFSAAAGRALIADVNPGFPRA